MSDRGKGLEVSRGSIPVLEAENLVKSFPVKGGGSKDPHGGSVKAVQDVSFSLAKGETLALVGESGCGKSTLARLVVALLKPDSGSAYLNGMDIHDTRIKEMRRLRQQIQIVFQDPYSSLNPRMSVFDLIAEGWRVHRDLAPPKVQRERVVGEMLERVGLSPRIMNRYPHEFSGGQRQRIGIARALSVNPQILVCDEPLSALDISIQAQIIELLRDLQRELNLSYLFISHDLSVVRQLADRVAVMYLGRIVEMGTADEIFDQAVHPYTQGLLAAVPTLDRGNSGRGRVRMGGDIPNPTNPPSGCGFRTRCWKAKDSCAEAVPDFRDRGHGHASACLFAEQLQLSTGRITPSVRRMDPPLADR